MNGEFARATGSSLNSGRTTSALAPVSEFMRWNDMTTPTSWYRPSLQTARTDTQEDRPDDD